MRRASGEESISPLVACQKLAPEAQRQSLHFMRLLRAQPGLASVNSRASHRLCVGQWTWPDVVCNWTWIGCLSDETITAFSDTAVSVRFHGQVKWPRSGSRRAVLVASTRYVPFPLSIPVIWRYAGAKAPSASFSPMAQANPVPGWRYHPRHPGWA